MPANGLGWMFVAETALLGFIGIFLPRIARRGLLFGVYVGEKAFDGDAAQAIRRSWAIGMSFATVACVAAGAILATTGVSLLIVLIPELALVAIAVLLYVRAYRAARAIARDGTGDAVPPPLPELGIAHARTSLPWLVMAVSLIVGATLIYSTASRYDALPERVPVHFNAAGTPDRFSVKSPASVFGLPVMTAVMGLFLGGLGILIARVRPALRTDDGGTSIAAQVRFRAATARFLSGTALLVVAMLASLSMFSLRVARGIAPGLPKWMMLLVLALIVWTLGGVIYLFARYGQGGSKLEGATAAPLADGLADNRYWRMGVFYVNPDDASWLVEKRFGLGYTINFGNPWALGSLVAFLVALVGLAVWAAV